MRRVSKAWMWATDVSTFIHWNDEHAAHELATVLMMFWDHKIPDKYYTNPTGEETNETN